MKNKLEVGMYARTTDGLLWKPKKIEIDEDGCYLFDGYYYIIHDTYINLDVIGVNDLKKVLDKYQVIKKESENVDLWIRSQNKKILIKASELFVQKHYGDWVITDYPEDVPAVGDIALGGGTGGAGAPNIALSPNKTALTSKEENLNSMYKSGNIDDKDTIVKVSEINNVQKRVKVREKNSSY